MKRTLTLVLLLTASTFMYAQSSLITTVTATPSAANCGDTVMVYISGILPCSWDVRDSIKTNVVGTTVDIDLYYHNPTHPACGLALIMYTDSVPLIGLGGGSYTVNASYIHATAGSDSGTATFSVTNCCPAVADLSASDTVICEGGMLSFSDTSTFGTAWWWKENGVTFSTNPLNATHTFNTPGYRTVRLVTGDGICLDSTEMVIGVKTAPTASFNSVPNLNNYQFYDQSNAWMAEYLWDFGDGNTDTAQHPAHTYADTGLHIVCLTVTNSCGTDSTCQTINVQCPLPRAGFSFTYDSLTVTFTDTSTSNVDTYFWTFGDGAFSGTKNTSYTYASAGSYMVCLKTTNTCGVDSVCHLVTVGGTGVNDLDIYGLTIYPNPFNDRITIDGLPAGTFTARFHDVLGRLVEAEVRQGKIEAQLQTGAYILEVFEGNEPVWRGRMIKQ